MNIRFSILWYEDELPWYESIEPDVEQFIRNHQLEPKFSRQRGDDLSADELTSNDFDLILMDYKLISGQTGDIIIQKIRDAHILTDILFYSSHYGEMIEVIKGKSPPIDGIYYADRKDFRDKAEKLINKIVRRSEDLVNLRGFVLDSSSDFELRIKNLLGIAWPKLKAHEKDAINKQMREHILSALESFRKKVEKVCSEVCIFTSVYDNDKSKNNSINYSNNDWLVVLKDVIQIYKQNYYFSPASFPKNFLKEYSDKIASYRTKLAHQPVTSKHILVKNKSVSIDDKLHMEMRNNIRHIESLIQILEEFTEECI